MFYQIDEDEGTSLCICLTFRIKLPKTLAGKGLHVSRAVTSFFSCIIKLLRRLTDLDVLWELNNKLNILCRQTA